MAHKGCLVQLWHINEIYCNYGTQRRFATIMAPPTDAYFGLFVCQYANYFQEEKPAQVVAEPALVPRHTEGLQRWNATYCISRVL